MVAALKDRTRAIFGTAVLVVLLASSLPLTSGQTDLLPPITEPTAGWNIMLRQGEVVIKGKNQAVGADNPPLTFLQGNRTYYVDVPIYNTGTQATPTANLPVWVWFDENRTGDPDKPGYKPGSAIRCRSVGSIPAAGTQPGKVVVTIPLELRTLVVDTVRDPEGTILSWVNGYTMRILVNRDPSAPEGDPNHVPGYTRQITGCPGVRSDENLQDRDASDNMVVSHFVKDAKRDLVVESVKWCRGEAHLAAGYTRVVPSTGEPQVWYGNEKVCDAEDVSEDRPSPYVDSSFLNYTSEMVVGEQVYNTTRKHENSTCTISSRSPSNPSGCSPHYNVPNGTYFEIKAANAADAAWQGDEDLGAPGCLVDPDDASTCDPFLPNARSVPVNDRGQRCLVNLGSRIGSAASAWYNVSVTGCPGYQFEYDLRIANLTENARTSPITLANLSAFPRGELARSVTWHMINWTGPFQVFATVNHRDGTRFPDSPSTNNDFLVPDPTPAEGAPPEFPFEVAWADLEPQFVLDGENSNLRTDPADPYPFDVDREIEISFSILLRNHGSGEPTEVKWQGNPPRPAFVPKPIRWNAFLDGKILTASITGTVLRIGDASTPIGDDHYVNETFRNTTTVGDPNYIGPGAHTLCIRIDSAVPDVARETNESNNEKCVDIFVEDNDPPDFLPLAIGDPAEPRMTSGSSRNGTPIDRARGAEIFWVHANLTDNDIAGLSAVAQFTLVDNESVTRNYTMTRHLSHPDVTTADTTRTIRTMTTGRIADFRFHGENGTVENWTMKVIAKDRSGGVTESDDQPFQLVRWGIQTKNGSHIVLGVPNDQGTFDPNDKEYPFGQQNLVINWEIEVYSNETGIVDPKTGKVDQANVTDNLALYVFAPNGQTFYVNGTNATTGAGWQKMIRCDADDTVPVGAPQAPELVCTGMNRFRSPAITKELGGPGRWYVNINVTDIAGDVRSINRTFVLKDSLPILTNHSITATQLNAGQDLGVVVNMTDDFDIDIDNGGAMVNFTRTRDNRTFSVPLTNKTSASFGGRTNYTFNDTITTGFGQELDEAGEFLVRFVARDTQGNWNATPPLTFTLQDSRAPNVHTAGVDQALQEIGLNVTFRAHVTDETNVTVRLRVHPAGSDEDIFAVNMTPIEGDPRNYTWRANFSREGSYIWEIFATDSALQTSSVKTGPLTIASNLGPRFEIREPSVLIERERYAKAAPRLVLLVYDTDGVDKATIDLQVAGENVTPEDPVPAPAGINGYFVNYTVPSLEKFDHGDIVTVNLTAVDTSDKLLQGFLNFTFTVDDRAPTVTVKNYAPRYPLEDTGLVNVSLRTQFTLEALDNDDLPTGVESVRYRIFGGGNNTGEFVYTGPFAIQDAPGVYNGPKNYQIQFWAADVVGNQKPGYETLTVFVDDIPPSLDLLGSLPQGRYINATFIDTKSGVDRAVVWYSVNGAAFQVIPLDFVAGVWSTILPEGRKGDRVSYYLEAFDRVGNRETFGNVTEPYSTYTVGNHLPTIRFTAPVEGSRLARTVDVTWTAADEDGDSLVFTVYLRAPGRATFTELAQFQSSDTRRYPFDTTSYPDGEYTLRVTASDGSFVALAETRVSILNRASAFGVPGSLPDSVRAGTPVLLTVEVTKAQAVVEARVFRDGVLVQAYPMNDEGRDGDAVANDGKYSVRVPMDQNGRYSVEFHATYQEDGVQKEATIKGGDFVVERGLPGGIGLWLVLVGLAVVGGVGAAAFVLLRRRA